jgi:hypothetical protein
MAWACGYNKHSDILSDWENELFLLTVTLWILTDLLTNKMEHRSSKWATWITLDVKNRSDRKIPYNSSDSMEWHKKCSPGQGKGAMPQF